jgi:hypothetical protein
MLKPRKRNKIAGINFSFFHFLKSSRYLRQNDFYIEKVNIDYTLRQKIINNNLTVLLGPHFRFQLYEPSLAWSLLTINSHNKRNVMKRRERKRKRNENACADLLESIEGNAACIHLMWISSKDNCVINLPTRCYKCQSIAFLPSLYLSPMAYKTNKLKACFIADVKKSKFNDPAKTIYYYDTLARNTIMPSILYPIPKTMEI